MNKIALYSLLFLMASVGVTAQTNDSLKSELVHSQGTNRIEILHKLILTVWLNYPDKGMLYGHEALELSRKLNDSVNISKSLRLLAGVHYYKGDYDTSLDHNLQALEIAELIQDSLLINNGYNNIGLLYYNLGSYQSALEFLLRAKSIKEKLGETYGLPTTLNNLGLVYEEIADHKMARKYFFDALSLAKQLNYNDQIIYSQNNIGITYLKEGNNIIARTYFEKSLKLAEEIGNINWGAVSLRGIGEILEKRLDYDSANYYYSKSLSASESIEDKKGMSEANYLISGLECLKGNYEKAIQYLDKSQELAKNIQQRQLLLNNIKFYIEIYKKTADKDKIIEYQNAYVHFTDSLFKDIEIRNLALVPIKISEEAERLKGSRQRSELDRKDFVNNVLVMILVFATPLILVLIILIRNNISTNRKLLSYNNEILSQKEEIQSQKEIVEENNKKLELAKNLINDQKIKLEILNRELSLTVDERTNELKTLNEELRITNLELDNLIYKSSHDIRGPLVRLMGVCNLALMEVKDKAALEYFRMLDKASRRLNNTVDKLKIVSELDRKEIITERIDFLFHIRHNLDQNKYIEGLDDVVVETEIAKNLAYFSDPAVIDLIIFNMIQNGVQLLKGTKEEPKKMKIIIEKSGDFLAMTFDIMDIELVIREDDGYYKMLAKDDEANHNLGIGLYTVKQCVRKLGGELLLLGNIMHATRFTINLPLNIRI